MLDRRQIRSSEHVYPSAQRDEISRLMSQGSESEREKEQERKRFDGQLKDIPEAERRQTRRYIGFKGLLFYLIYYIHDLSTTISVCV